MIRLGTALSIPWNGTRRAQLRLEWLGAGLPYGEFWQVTPGEAAAAIRARQDAARTDVETQRALNHELARLIAFAVHQPNKMPEYSAMKSPDLDRSSRADDETVRGFFMALAMRSKNG